MKSEEKWPSRVGVGVDWTGLVLVKYFLKGKCIQNNLQYRWTSKSLLFEIYLKY